MEKIYKKIVNGEIDIKYLSPLDLLNLTNYLETISNDLQGDLEKLRKVTSRLENNKVGVNSGFKNYVFDDEII